MTLGRIRPPGAPERLEARMAPLARAVMGESRVACMVLYSSVLGPGGAAYTPLYTAAFVRAMPGTPAGGASPQGAQERRGENNK